MKIATVVILNLLFFLALSSGIAKILQLDQEMAFFQETMGLSVNAIITLGAVQLLSAILLIVNSTRMIGAAILLLTFAGSSLLIFMNGQIGFGLFSLLPIAMSLFVIAICWRSRHSVGLAKKR